MSKGKGGGIQKANDLADRVRELEIRLDIAMVALEVVNGQAISKEVSGVVVNAIDIIQMRIQTSGGK